MVGPFVLLLLLIASGPSLFPVFWERFHGWIAVGLGACTALYYILGLERSGTLLHTALEYAAFMALVASLYVAGSGIFIRVRGESTPLRNVLFLLIGAVLANVLGTTGASMLLIRPWIRMNRYRITAFHIVFFIFLVSNVGGALTPVGDPPLFLGYLKGVPFWWCLQSLWSAWLFAVGALLLLFWVADRHNFLRAPEPVREAQPRAETFRIEGKRNFPLVLGILLLTLAPAGWREAGMVACGVVSYYWTPRPIHEANAFEWGPVKEVAWLFAGIFTTMLPALDLLQSHAPAMGLTSATHFYWAAGSLSALLDNAPTYLAFLAAGFGVRGGLNLDQDMPVFVQQHADLLKAVSLGAVFFGAMTYIGNGPNLMVKKIADQQGVHTPQFGAYIWRFALPLLLPVLLAVWWLFVA